MYDDRAGYDRHGRRDPNGEFHRDGTNGVGVVYPRLATALGWPWSLAEWRELVLSYEGTGHVRRLDEEGWFFWLSYDFVEYVGAYIDASTRLMGRRRRR